MNVLSLFDGISGAYQALKNINLKINKYYTSEVDKHAIQIAYKNHPDIIQLGDINNININSLPNIDLLIGGSPCQDLSIAKSNRKGLKGSKSQLFFKFLEIKTKIKPKYFILENVASMSNDSMQKITELIGVYPIMINSSLLTAQSRKRLYWTNIKAVQPFDKKICLKDILENGYIDRLKSFCITATYYKGINLKDYFLRKKRQIVFEEPIQLGYLKTDFRGRRVFVIEGKSPALLTGNNIYINMDGMNIRKLTPIECERLQGYPDDYTKGISNTQRYKCLGNSFTVPVIEHILKCEFVEGYREQFITQLDLF